MKTISGFNSLTAENLLLDTGAFFANFDIATDTFETALNKLIGATSGGGGFEAKPTIRDVKIDGVKGKAKGLQVLDNWSVTLSAKMLEFRKETFERALAAAKESNVSVNGASYTKIEAKNEIELTDYYDNITWIGTLSGSNEPVIIQIYNALNSDGLKIDTKDNSDITTELKFEGSYDPNNLDSPPFAIFYPNQNEDITPPTVTVVPADNATGVTVGSNVVFTFSEAIMPSTVNSSNFMLVKASDGSLVASTLALGINNTVVTLDPSVDLIAATAYMAIVTSNVKDVTGNSLANNTVINFTTA